MAPVGASSDVTPPLPPPATETGGSGEGRGGRRGPLVALGALGDRWQRLTSGHSLLLPLGAAVIVLGAAGGIAWGTGMFGGSGGGGVEATPSATPGVTPSPTNTFRHRYPHRRAKCDADPYGVSHAGRDRDRNADCYPNSRSNRNADPNAGLRHLHAYTRATPSPSATVRRHLHQPPPADTDPQETRRSAFGRDEVTANPRTHNRVPAVLGDGNGVENEGQKGSEFGALPHRHGEGKLPAQSVFDQNH